MKKSVRTALICLCVVFLGVFAFSAYKIVSTLQGYKEAEQTYTNIAEEHVTIITSPTPVPKEEVKGDGIDPEVSPIGNVDFEGLRAKSTDYAAWIYSPDTVINYPIVYTDNNFYYLDHIPVEQYNSAGTLFIDCKCAADFSDQNTLIYGHNMKTGAMFGSLRNYENLTFYRNNPFITFDTAYEDGRYVIFAVATVSTTQGSWRYVDFTRLSSPVIADRTNAISALLSRSIYRTQVDVAADDQLLLLVTCVDDVPIGFVTWDPRNRPEYVEIGHNGIRTAYKRKGYGRMQLEEALRRIRAYEGLKRIIVCTNSEFVATRNYESVGFQLYDRKPNDTESAYTGDYLYYEIRLREE